MNPLSKIQRTLYQTGGYLCSHFEVQKIPDNKVKKQGCCGKTGDQYVPVCSLVNGICVGLAKCPRLNVQDKSAHIQDWKKDIQKNKMVNPLDYVKR